MNHKMQNRLLVCILALVCCGLWGSAFPCIKLGYQLLDITGIGSQILFAGYRFFTAGVLLFLFGSIWEKRILTMKKASVPSVLGQGILQTTVQYLFFYIGLANTTGAKSSIINAASSFISIMAAPFILKTEKITWRNSLGCVLGLSGVVIIHIMPGAWGSGFRLSGEGMLLLAAAAYGISTITLKMIAHSESIFTLNAYQLLFGGMLLTMMGWLMGGCVTGFDLKSLVLFLYLAFLTTTAFTLWTVLLKYNHVSKVAVYGFMIPVFGVVLSGLMLHEQIINIRNLAALIFICTGIILVNLSRH